MMADFVAALVLLGCMPSPHAPVHCRPRVRDQRLPLQMQNRRSPRSCQMHRRQGSQCFPQPRHFDQAQALAPTPPAFQAAQMSQLSPKAMHISREAEERELEVAWRAGRPPAVADTPPPAVSGGQPQKGQEEEPPHVGLMSQQTGQPPQSGRQLIEEGIAEEEPQHERLMKGQPEQQFANPACQHAADAWGCVGQRGGGVGPASHPPTVQPSSSAGPSQRVSPNARSNVVASGISLPFAKVRDWDRYYGRFPRSAAAPFSGSPWPHEAERREAERTNLDSAAAEQWQGNRLQSEEATGCMPPPRQRTDEMWQRLPQGATAGNSPPQLQQLEQEIVTQEAVALPRSDLSAQERVGLTNQIQQTASPKYGQVRSCMPSEHSCREH